MRLGLTLAVSFADHGICGFAEHGGNQQQLAQALLSGGGNVAAIGFAQGVQSYSGHRENNRCPRTCTHGLTQKKPGS